MSSYHQLQPQRPCPICGHEQVDLLYSQVFSALSSGSLLTGYDVVVCINCGLGFADRIPLQSEFDRYYRDMSKYEFQDSMGKESPYDAARFDAIAELIAPFIPGLQARVLDVGCATGGLLYRLRLKGFENLTGIDPSPACAALASSQYQINVLTHTISELHETRNKYDFIILVGVLEHIRDLILHLDLLHNLLSENGRVFVEVPNALHFDGWPDAPYQQFSMEHINFFSPISVQNMMSKSVFRTVHIEELVRAQSLGTMMPVVAAIFEHTTIQEAKMHKCEQTGPSLTRYIQYSETIETRLQQTLTKLADSQKPILVWGTGTHTLHLMETTALSKVKIIAFIDSNPRYQNKAINGIPVIAPLDLPNYSLPILISSRVFQNDIVHQIRKNIGAQNDLILLYNDI